MRSYNVAEAKAHLSEILEQVLAGEEIILTRRGQPVARVIPAERTASMLGAGKHDPNINREVITKDDWWQNDEDAALWHD